MTPAEHEQAGAELRAIIANAGPLQRAWADAELAWAASRTPAVPDGDVELRAAVDAAAEAVRFNRACHVAAGEKFKGERFEDVVARNAAAGGHPRHRPPTTAEGLR